MKVLRSRRLARLAGCTALALGVAGTAVAVSAPAQAGVTASTFQPRIVASWGNNFDGTLGDGTRTSRSRFGDIRFANDVAQVAAGFGHSLALRSDGTVWAWGTNRNGQLGRGTTSDREATPAQVAGLGGVIQVAVGAYHSLALRSDGTVWAWGDNISGELGRGTTSDHEATPAQVTGLAGVTKISAGAAFSLALRSDGTVWAWGFNNAGQLGNGTTATSPVPVKVAGLSHVTGISAGGEASVATSTDGISVITSVWTWGANRAGQLGDGTLTSHSLPERVTGLPVYLAGITAGNQYVAVLGTDGSVWAWGADTSGQLGNAPASNPVTRPVNTIGAGSGITQISAGELHTLALKSDGTVLAWGDNSQGELGIGSTTRVTGPVQVTGLTRATQVAAGSVFSFAVHLPTVPDLSDDTTTQAAQELQFAGLVLGAVTKVIDNTCNHIGTVISQNPPAGTTLSPGSAVSIRIGQSPAKPCL
jgi:alpha-tubulin suppressor-like RCC1 family protein